MSMPGEQSATPATHDDRLRRIESMTGAALAHLDVEYLLIELLDRVRELLQVDTATVFLLNTSQLVATAARGIEAMVRQGIRIPMGKGFVGRIAAEKRPMIIDRVDDKNVLYYSILREHGICSLLGVPLLSSGTVIGVLHVGTLVPRRFTADDVRLLQIAADQVAFATQSRRAEVERAAAAVLQRSLLPAQLPVVPGLELAARYVPAQNGGVSGDWYDVFTLPSGWLCIIIGDVVGRGFGAADVMGRLRSALRSYALLGGNPTEVLGRLDQYVQHFEPEMMATVLLAMFEPSFERLHLSSAGHPPPVLALPDRPSTLLDVPSDHPVGVPGGLRRRATTVTMPLGALLCFYTDGLVESRDTTLETGLEQLCESIMAGPVDLVCSKIMARLIGDVSPGDDVAVLAVRRQDSGEIGPLDLVVPALPWSLRDIRVAVRRWLAAVGAAPSAIADLLVAVGEACTNAVEHAYGPGGGTVTVHLELQLPDVLASVRDTGRWRLPRGENRGRGTLFMRNCSDDLRIDHGPTGTNVVIRRCLAERVSL
jgi:serine phosphatase RsbU (regulator of sigma subunit)/anti-sigma regulatory factor (Ser/Thr protein kinase)